MTRKVLKRRQKNHGRRDCKAGIRKKIKKRCRISAPQEFIRNVFLQKPYPILILSIFQTRRLCIYFQMRHNSPTVSAVSILLLAHAHHCVFLSVLSNQPCNRYKVSHQRTLICKRNTYLFYLANLAFASHLRTINYGNEFRRRVLQRTLSACRR